MTLGSVARAADLTSAEAASFSIARGVPAPQSAHAYTLLDPDQEVLPLPPQYLADVLGQAAEPPSPPAGPPAALSWRLDYRHSLLDQMTSSAALRNDPSTGFSRQLDRDVVDLGLTWRLADSQIGFAYEVQSARAGNASIASLSRFLPGNQQATHAVTLGVTRHWGAGAPPPAPVAAAPFLPADSAVDATPAPSTTPRR